MMPNASSTWYTDSVWDQTRSNNVLTQDCGLEKGRRPVWGLACLALWYDKAIILQLYHIIVGSLALRIRHRWNTSYYPILDTKLSSFCVWRKGAGTGKKVSLKIEIAKLFGQIACFDKGVKRMANERLLIPRRYIHKLFRSAQHEIKLRSEIAP